MKLLLTICCLLSCPVLHAQVHDSTLIRETALNYVGGFYNADPARMKKAVHPELAKRILLSDKNNAFIKDMGATELLFNTTKYKKPEDGDKAPFQATVYIYDIYEGTATAKVVTNKFKFIDYLHLVKINNEWQIINVLWAFNK